MTVQRQIALIEKMLEPAQPLHHACTTGGSPYSPRRFSSRGLQED